jgi:deazaflavin-dependent oxidoreductase (nitroreductase family)
MSLVRGSQFVHLVTTGARSGEERTAEISAHEYGDAVFLIGTNFGRKNNPGWYHNLVANPDGRLVVNGQSHAVRARVAEGDERDRLMSIGKRHFPGYSEFERRSGRHVPVVVLDPA